MLDLEQEQKRILTLPRQCGKTTALIAAAAVLAERGYLPIFLAQSNVQVELLQRIASELFSKLELKPPRYKKDIKGYVAIADEIFNFTSITLSGGHLVMTDDVDDMSFLGEKISKLHPFKGIFGCGSPSHDFHRYNRQYICSSDPSFGLLPAVICPVCTSEGKWLIKSGELGKCSYCGAPFNMEAINKENQWTNAELNLLAHVSYCLTMQIRFAGNNQAPPRPSTHMSYSTHSSGTYGSSTYSWTNTTPSSTTNFAPY